MIKYIMLISSGMVLIVMNPVQALLWLVVVFICASLILIEMGGEFIAILLILVYIGAIAVLFLFIIMLLNIRLIELVTFFIYYNLIFFLVSIFFFLQISFLIFFRFYEKAENIILFNWLNNIDYSLNIEVLSVLFFKIYFHYFFLLSFILFVSLLGTLILINTKKKKKC